MLQNISHISFYIYESGKLSIRFWWGGLMERDHLEHLGTDEDNIMMDLEEMGLEVPHKPSKKRNTAMISWPYHICHMQPDEVRSD
jgi:hypothetical protein